MTHPIGSQYVDAEWLVELQARCHADPVLRFELFCVYELGQARGRHMALQQAELGHLLDNPFSLTSIEAFVANADQGK